MLQLPVLREQRERCIEGLKKRGLQNVERVVDDLLGLDEQRKEVKKQLDDALNQSNQLSRQIGAMMKEGRKAEAEEIKQKTALFKQEAKKLSDQLASIETSLSEQLYNVPNIPHETVPAGSTPDDNEVVFQVDDLPNLGDKAIPHWDLVKEYDIIDFELGNKITGAGFPVYKKQGARLMRGLINYFLDQAADAGYMEIQPPVLVNEASGYATGQLPDKEGQMYQISETDYYLIPTAEVPITNLYRDRIIEGAELPVRNVGFTPCFRKEAGSWGSHVRGLNRLHQFDKVEIVQIQYPEQSYSALQKMLDHVEQLIKNLELPYRILNLCGGDLGFTSAKTYDFEVYSAAQKKWLEVSSVSNFETYQANRLKLRYKDDNKKTRLLHTLNGSALALPRIVAALLENNQTAEGIKIPKVLQSYCSMELIAKP